MGQDVGNSWPVGIGASARAFNRVLSGLGNDAPSWCFTRWPYELPSHLPVTVTKPQHLMTRPVRMQGAKLLPQPVQHCKRPPAILCTCVERRTFPSPKRSFAPFTAAPAIDGTSPDDILCAYANSRSSTQATPGINRSASPFTPAPSSGSTAPDDALRAYTER